MELLKHINKLYYPNSEELVKTIHVHFFSWTKPGKPIFSMGSPSIEEIMESQRTAFGIGTNDPIFNTIKVGDTIRVVGQEDDFIYIVKDLDILDLTGNGGYYTGLAKEVIKIKGVEDNGITQVRKQ